MFCCAMQPLAQAFCASDPGMIHSQCPDKWTIFNDRKVAVSEEPPFDLGYIYLYESIGPA
jgi:hypothetical protein